MLMTVEQRVKDDCGVLGGRVGLLMRPTGSGVKEGGGGLHRFDTAMTADSSRGRKSFKKS